MRSVRGLVPAVLLALSATPGATAQTNPPGDGGRSIQDRPGSLKRQQYVDVLAYIFELNGVPPGEEEMPTRKRALEAILIEVASEG